MFSLIEHCLSNFLLFLHNRCLALYYCTCIDNNSIYLVILELLSWLQVSICVQTSLSWLQVRSSSAAISTVPGSSSVPPLFFFSFLISFKMSLNASHFGLSSNTGSVDKKHLWLPVSYINHKHQNKSFKTPISLSAFFKNI